MLQWPTLGRLTTAVAPGSRWARVGAQVGPGVLEVLEDVGGDQRVEGPESGGVPTSPAITRSRRVAASRGVLGLELDPGHVRGLAGLQRGAGGAGRAAEVEHPPGAGRDVVEDLGAGALVGGGARGALSGPHGGRY